MKHKGHTNPPGRQKIIEALTRLMWTKEFHSVTTAEIAELAGVTEGLIYKYFKSKKELLYQVLNDLFAQFNQAVLDRMADKASAIEKLEIIIRSSIEYYTANRVFARILLLEVRTSPDYFSSEAYTRVKAYARTILEVIRMGIQKGEIIFARDLDVQAITHSISTIIFNGAKA